MDYKIINEMSLRDKVWFYLNDYWDLIADPRTNNFPLVSGGIWKILLIMSSYLVLTRVILPMYMRNRKPYELRNTMMVYVSIILSIILSIMLSIKLSI